MEETYAKDIEMTQKDDPQLSMANGGVCIRGVKIDHQEVDVNAGDDEPSYIEPLRQITEGFNLERDSLLNNGELLALYPEVQIPEISKHPHHSGRLPPSKKQANIVDEILNEKLDDSYEEEESDAYSPRKVSTKAYTHSSHNKPHKPARASVEESSSKGRRFISPKNLQPHARDLEVAHSELDAEIRGNEYGTVVQDSKLSEIVVTIDNNLCVEKCDLDQDDNPNAFFVEFLQKRNKEILGYSKDKKLCLELLFPLVADKKRIEKAVTACFEKNTGEKSNLKNNKACLTEIIKDAAYGISFQMFRYSSNKFYASITPDGTCGYRMIDMALMRDKDLQGVFTAQTIAAMEAAPAQPSLLEPGKAGNILRKAYIQQVKNNSSQMDRESKEFKRVERFLAYLQRTIDSQAKITKRPAVSDWFCLESYVQGYCPQLQSLSVWNYCHKDAALHKPVKSVRGDGWYNLHFHKGSSSKVVFERATYQDMQEVVSKPNMYGYDGSHFFPLPFEVRKKEVNRLEEAAQDIAAQLISLFLRERTNKHDEAKSVDGAVTCNLCPDRSLDGALTCSLCPEVSFTSSKNAVHHMNSKHKSLLIPVEELTTCRPCPYHRCQTCAQVCLSEKGLNMHFSLSPQCNLTINLSNVEEEIKELADEQEPKFNITIPNKLTLHKTRKLADLTIGASNSTSRKSSPLEAKRLGDLIATFQRGLYYVPKAWRENLQQLTLHLLEQVTSNDKQLGLRGLASLLLLPGLVTFLQYAKRRKEVKKIEPLSLITAALNSSDSVEYILEKAEEWQDLAVEQNSKRKRSKKCTVAHLVKRIHWSTANYRLKQARWMTDELAVRLKRADQKVEGEEQDDEAVDQPVHQLDVEEAKEIVARLHPSAGANDTLPPVPDGCNNIVLADIEVDNCLRELDLDSSSGPSAWSFASINNMLKAGDEADHRSFISNLTKVFNLILSGKASPGIRELWTTVREVLFLKDESNYRPIGIGHAFDRIMGRAVLKKVQEKVVAYLAPLQLGIGIPSGAEIGARLAHLSLHRPDAVDHEGQAILALDCRNAFNSINRKAIFNGLERVCPELLHWFKWAYGEPATIRWGDGEVIGKLSTGVPQGHVLSGLCYALGAQPCLERLQELLREEEKNQQERFKDTERPPGILTAFFDDITISGERQVIYKVAGKAESIFAEHGLTLEVKKSEIISRNTESSENVPKGFKLSTEGGKILGVPTGSKAYVDEEFIKNVNDKLPSVEAISRIDKRCAFRLLFYSYNTLLVYLSRICEFGSPMVHKALKDFDDRIDRCIAAIAGEDIDDVVPNRVKIIRELRQKKGGLGMQRYYGVATERNIVLSRAATRSFAVTYHPHLIKAMDDERVWAHIRLGWTEGEQTEAEAANPGGAIPGTITGGRAGLSAATKAVVLSLLEQKFIRLHNKLNADGEQPNAAYLLSSAKKGTGRWLISMAGLEPGNGYFNGKAFGIKLRQRLLLPMWKPKNPNEPLYCVCGGPSGAARFDLRYHSHHEQVCQRGSGTRTLRHHAIRDYLAALLRKVLNVEVNTEAHYYRKDKDGPVVSASKSEQNGEKFIADIEYRMNNKHYLVDIAVVSPASEEALNRDESNKKEAAAASRTEKDKTEKYKKAFPSIGTGFIPFVIEDSGRYGASAISYLASLTAQTDDVARSNATREVEQFNVAVAMELARTSVWLIEKVNEGLEA